MSQTRRFIQPYQIVTDGDMSANITSPSVDISNVDDISIVYDWVGTSPIGTLIVQVKNGDSPWSQLDISPPASVLNNSGNNNIQITNVSFKELRLAYNHTSGTGTLNAYLTGKGR